MVIREILKKSDKLLLNSGIKDSYNESLLLFAHAAGRSKTYIYTHMDEDVEEKTKKKFTGFIEKRSKKMPVAYIVGSAWFMSMEFLVDESTLIPRPETEGLVEQALICAKRIKAEKIKVLDMCTGTGCIGLSIAKYDKRAFVTLTDVNQQCLNIADRNSIKHGLSKRVTLINSDLYNSLENEKFSIITVNPPYISDDEISNLDDDVRLYEPLTALSGGVNGLDYYVKLAAKTKNHLIEGGCLILEIGIMQREAVSEIFQENGFLDISVKEDLSGIPRIITVR